MKKISTLFLFICTLLFIFSCKSAPKAAESEETSAEIQTESDTSSAEEVDLVSADETSAEEVELISTDEARADALAGKEKADSMKASVAVKSKYEEVLAIFNEAEGLRDSDNDPDRKTAIDKYAICAEGFYALYEEASEKYEAAKAEYDKALSAIAETEKEAEVLDNAIKEAEGGEE